MEKRGKKIRILIALTNLFIPENYWINGKRQMTVSEPHKEDTDAAEELHHFSNDYFSELTLCYFFFMMFHHSMKRTHPPDPRFATQTEVLWEGVIYIMAGSFVILMQFSLQI